MLFFENVACSNFHVSFDMKRKLIKRHSIHSVVLLIGNPGNSFGSKRNFFFLFIAIIDELFNAPLMSPISGSVIRKKPFVVVCPFVTASLTAH